MSSQLVPANPAEVMVIRHVTPNVVTCSVPFLRFGIMPIGGRGTIVKMTNGAIAVFSPVALTPDVRAKITELGGNVQYLAALDLEHHLFLSDWAAAYPSAKLIGVQGLPEKRSKARNAMVGPEPFTWVFEASEKGQVRIDADFDADFEYEYIPEHANKELVVLYKPDRVLIEADLVFNLPPSEQYSRVPPAQKPTPAFLTRLLAGAQSTAGDAMGQKRFIWYLLSRSNREGFSESVRRIASWDFTTLIPCHGDVIEGNAKEVYQKVFAWHLQGKK